MHYKNNGSVKSWEESYSSYVVCIELFTIWHTNNINWNLKHYQYLVWMLGISPWVDEILDLPRFFHDYREVN